ncbi:hypothetical protein CEE34_00005, partial [Candidatus Aerophobetes bacterium Ae_b3a]
KIRGLSGEREKLREALENLGKKETKDYFLWEIDFAEIFAEKGGFDIVIGNPPYVRQEKIAFPLEKEENYENPEEWRARKRLYKEKLASSVKMHWGNAIKINKKSDLYVYFYYHGLALLRPSGIFCFINSNSWLDVGYGACLQEFLLKNMEPLYIVDNQAKRSFKESDVNTIIVAVKRPEEVKDTTMKFVNYKKPFEEVLTADNLVEIERSSKVTSTDDFRVFPITKKELLKDGVELPKEKTLLGRPEDLPYIGSKWGGKYLRAPDIFFKILEKGKGKLVSLEPNIGKVITVSWSRKGRNKYLLIPKTTRISTSELVGDVIKTPKEINTITFTKNLTHHYLRLTKDVKNEVKKARLLWVDIRGDKHICHNNVDAIYFTHNFHGIVVHDNSLNSELCAVLNSTIVWLFVEVLGRRGLGGGAVRLLVEDLRRTPIVIDFFHLSLEQRKNIETILRQRLSQRPVKSVFEELGLPKPNRDYSNVDPNDVSLDKVMPDRRELDKVIFKTLGLTEEEQLEVYRAIVGLVKNRLIKARSV